MDSEAFLFSRAPTILSSLPYNTCCMPCVCRAVFLSMTFDYAKEETPNGIEISSGLIDIKKAVFDTHFFSDRTCIFSMI